MKELVDEVNERQISISAGCDILETNCKTYDNNLKPKENAYKLRREELSVKIKQIHKGSKEIYGAPKITCKLRSQGEVVSNKLVGNIMRELGLKAHYAKPWTKTTKDCDFSKELKHILNRGFNPAKPNAVWCTDMTYIWTNENGFVYLILNSSKKSSKYKAKFVILYKGVTVKSFDTFFAN